MVGVNELKEIAIKCGTPSYIFDTDELCARIDAMQQILGCGVTVCYAMKALSLIHISEPTRPY